MLVAFELSGEHPDLAASEVCSSLTACQVSYHEVDRTRELLIVEIVEGTQTTERLKAATNRCALSHRCLEVLSWGATDKLPILIKRAGEILKDRAGHEEKFRLRLRRVGGITPPPSLNEDIGEGGSVEGVIAGMLGQACGLGVRWTGAGDS